MTDDLRSVSHDVHAVLHYSEGPKPLTPAEQEARAKLASSSGFVSVERLSGNVALLRIDAFDQFPAPGGAVEAAYAENMTHVADASALILDLRANYGGYPESVALLLSYLVDSTPVHLTDIQDRNFGNMESWTRAQVKGTRFGSKKAVFVLTSKETISGGEEAAYDLQALKRATIVGETTRGGANVAPQHKLDEHFTVLVPEGRAVNPITHGNWEGVGVVPDVAVDASSAPREAHVRALRALLASLPEGANRGEVEKALAAMSH